MCGKGGSSGGMGGLAPAQQVTVSPSPQAMAWYNQTMGQAQQVASQPYQYYGSRPEDFVAQLNPAQMQAIGGLGGLAAAAQPYAQYAPAMAAQSGMANAAQMAGGYMNPYMQQVINPVTQGLQQQFGQQLAEQQAQAIKGGAFGGTRSDLARAMLQGQQGLALGQTLSPLYQTGYGQALQGAQTDLARQLQAAQGLQAAGQGAQQAALSGATLGQQTQQAGINALYNQFQQAQMFPYMQAQFLAGVAGGLGPLTGQTTTQSQAQSPFGMFLSDPRAKTGVDREAPDEVGQLHDGQKVYAYRYKDGGPAQIGLMADEVAERHPDAVGLRPDGLMAVDYGKATEDAARMGGAVREGGDYARGGYADGGIAGADLGALLAAHEAMYGNLKPIQMSIPTEGIRTGTPLTASQIAAGERPKTGLETMQQALGVGESLTDLLSKGFDAYDWYKTGKRPESLGGKKAAKGGYIAPNEEEDLWKGLTGGIQTGRPLEASKISQPDDGKRSDSFLDKASDVVGTAGKIGSGLAGLYSAATTFGPMLMALSDPRAKTGVGRAAYQGGGYADEDIEQFLRPLAKGETGGEKDPYGALGPMTKRGDRAYGKYQIMGANIPSWTKEALGRAMTPEEFLADREAQEATTRHRFGQYLNKAGTPAEAAAMWFGGPGYKKHMGAKDVLGTSIPEYMSRYERNMGLGDGLKALGPRERSFMASAELPPEGKTVDLKKGLGSAAEPAAKEPARGLGDILTDKQVMVPLLTGLGTGLTTMVGTPSRYLGTALLAGAGAGLASGAKSYMDVAKQIPEIQKLTAEAKTQEAETKAREQLVKKMGYETYQEFMKAVQSSTYKNAAGVPIVRLSDGSEVPYYTYSENPSKYPPPASSMIKPPSVAEAAAGTGAAEGKAPPTRPLRPETGAVQAPPGVVFTPQNASAAKAETRIIGTPGEEDARKRGADYRTKIDRLADEAQGQLPMVNEAAGIVAEAASEKGIGAAGAGGTMRARAINYGNTVIRMMPDSLKKQLGIPDNYFGANDTRDQLLNKLAVLSGKQGLSQTHVTALEGLSKFVGAQPNLDMTPDAMRRNAAQNMVNTQMALDEQRFADTYDRANGNLGLYSRAGVEFKNSAKTGKYTKEVYYLDKVMKDHPQDFMDMVSGKASAELINKYFKDNYGLDGMERYFGAPR